MGIILQKMQTKSTSPLCHTIPNATQSKMGTAHCKLSLQGRQLPKIMNKQRRKAIEIEALDFKMISN